MINSSDAKLCIDESYSAKTRQELFGYVVTLNDAKESFQYIKQVISEFKGNVEKFYPKFYKCV